jgi:hypothetical protein
VASSPIVAALGPPDTERDAVSCEVGVEQTASSLLDAFRQVPDPRLDPRQLDGRQDVRRRTSGLPLIDSSRS